MFGHPAQDLGSRLVGDELAASGAQAALLQEHLEFDEQSDQSFQFSPSFLLFVFASSFFLDHLQQKCSLLRTVSILECMEKLRW